ncbi:WxL domain-containing protein [Enterococcus sp. DIV0170]|uniref:WxL domain-containing protein n=1 Tax=Enterococcus sp. DIV0170 TaxID=2774642 RepID=UPI003F24D1F6
MNKKIKYLVSMFIFMGTIFGVVVNPTISNAFTVSYPAATTYVEFKDQKGNDFPIPLIVEGKYVTVMGATVQTVNPLLITKIGGQNTFSIDIPAFNGTVGSGQRYQEYTSKMKINTPLPFVKSFKGIPTNGSLPTMNTISHYREVDGVPWNGIMYVIECSKQSDDTFDLPILGSNIGGYQSNLFYRIMDKDMTWTMQEAFDAYGVDGDVVRFYATFYQIKEIFENHIPTESIPAPPGYVNGNLTDIDSDPFHYQMTNDSALPQSYEDSGFIYTYKGWYKGAGNKANIDTTYPPSINFTATMNESADEVHIVYQKYNGRKVTEEYIDPSSNMIDTSWNSSKSVIQGSVFTQTPAATKTDSSGTEWEYQGWKFNTEPMSAIKTGAVATTINVNRTIQYVYKKKEHTITEKWVDYSDGSTLIPMAGNPKTTAVDDNDPFNGLGIATITDSSGDIWDYIGWENVTDAVGTVVPAGTPLVISNIKGSKEIRYHYQARNTTATLDLNPTPQVTTSGGNVAWSSRLTNTGTSTLNNLKLKATSNWAAGLSAPTQVTVTPAGGSSQNFTVSPTDWTSGFNLTGINIPSGGPNNYADITFTDTATGSVNQVLPAEIEIDGNMASPLTAENFVRIDDPDEPNLKPSGNAGLINIPDFRFGDVEVKPYAQTKGLDAASYQSGYNPYIRFMDQESLSGWSLTAKLGQFTSGAKTLPTTTAIQLNNGDLKEVQNYNKDNESLSSIGSAGNKSIPSDSTTVALTNGAAQGVYQLDYAFGDVELDLLAHSGIAGLSYTADMDWTLTTAP